MANMSYCRFENTVSDLADCADAFNEMELRDGKWGNIIYDDYLDDSPRFEELNQYEQPKVRELAEIAKRFLDDYQMMTGEKL